jgi:hypothetical protein
MFHCSVNMILFEPRVFVDVIQLRILDEITVDLEWILNPMTAVLIRERRGRQDTESSSSEDGSRDKSDAALRQGTPKVSSCHHSMEQTLPQSLQKRSTCRHLGSGLLVARTVKQ